MRTKYVWGGLAAAVVLIGLLGVLHGSADKYGLADRKEAYANSAENKAPSDGEHRGYFGGKATASSSVTSTAGMGGKSENAPADENPETAAKLTLASMSDSQVDRYLIKNATVLVEAKDVIQAANQAKSFAKSVNGYVSSSHESEDNLGLKNVALEVRVPATQFDAAMQSVQGLGRVLDNQITSEDVTEQYVDTDSQLRNLKMTEGRLLEHLSRTGKLSDTLLIETELTRVRESLNELEGKLRFMSHRVSYSTVSLTFKEPAHIEPIAPTESFSLGQVTSQAMRSFTGFLQQVIAVGIWVLIWSVLWAPIAVLGRIVWVRQRGRFHA